MDNPNSKPIWSLQNDKRTEVERNVFKPTRLKPKNKMGIYSRLMKRLSVELTSQIRPPERKITDVHDDVGNDSRNKRTRIIGKGTKHYAYRKYTYEYGTGPCLVKVNQDKYYRYYGYGQDGRITFLQRYLHISPESSLLANTCHCRDHDDHKPGYPGWKSCNKVIFLKKLVSRELKNSKGDYHSRLLN